MNKSGLFGALGCLGVMIGLPVAHAQQADHPRLMPTRDVTVDYAVTHEGAPQPQAVRVYFGGEGARLRVDGPNGVGATILDRTAQQVTVVLNRQRVYTQFNPREGLRNPFLLDLSMQFTRKGASSQAGQACTEWGITARQGNATACVTDDGVILREDGVDADGMRGRLEATTVTYAPIASTMFAPPADYQRVSHGGGAGGASAAAPGGGAATAGAGAAETPQPAPATGTN
ncbi:hypothetical protein AA103196_0318 [Ameyamaea chiangmaiensis NBRC 103196]|nr:hypothetical protein AA103196_0318 [Ameyamaea chiangmaiensis NBRC 103196]